MLMNRKKREKTDETGSGWEFKAIICLNLRESKRETERSSSLFSLFFMSSMSIRMYVQYNT